MELAVTCQLLLYADDSVLLASDRNPKVIAETLSENLETCDNWLIDNRLLLHLGKTETMICGTEYKIKKKEGFSVKCKDSTINSTTEVKYLGIKTDETLSGNGILDTILKKCNGRIKFLYRQARCFHTALKKTLCQSLVQSHLDYAISSWYVAMTQKAKNKLQIIQNEITRFILDLGPKRHTTTKHTADLNTLKLPERAKQLRLTTTHKIYYKQTEWTKWPT